MIKTRCNYCGDTSHIQRAGNLCHTCSRGIMIDEQVKEEDIRMTLLEDRLKEEEE